MYCVLDGGPMSYVRVKCTARHPDSARLARSGLSFCQQERLWGGVVVYAAGGVQTTVVICLFVSRRMYHGACTSCTHRMYVHQDLSSTKPSMRHGLDLC